MKKPLGLGPTSAHGHCKISTRRQDCCIWLDGLSLLAGPSSEELLDYAITPDFKEFIRSLTYSTFRDFPLDQLPPMDKNCDDKVLTPWQEKHALLVVQEVDILLYTLYHTLP